MKIDELDRNMAVMTQLEEKDIKWRNAKEEPFGLHGLYEPRAEGGFRRLPASVAKATSQGVDILSLNTAGGRVRFRTDSPYVAIHAEMKDICRMDHMAFTGIFGFDLYVERAGKEVYAGTLRPPVELQEGYESKRMLPGEGMRTVTINMPLYNNVDRLLIGLAEGSTLKAAPEYAYPVPVVYYGSSITQGGCASRPGNSYQAMISRMLGCDYVNLGFSGNARAEDPIVQYMAGLRMSVFVCDYDHNAPSVEHLKNTHGKLYRTLRERQPDLPMILVSRPDVHLNAEDSARRREVIEATYQQALQAGDRRIAYINGATLFEGPLADDCMVDGCHPNDLGFYRMAQVIGAEVARWLKK